VRALQVGLAGILCAVAILLPASTAEVAPRATAGGDPARVAIVAPRSVPAPAVSSTDGTAAVVRLGARLPSVARSHGWTDKELETTLLTDSTLRVDSTDRLFYVEPLVDSTAPEVEPAVAATLSAEAAPFPLTDTFKLHSSPGAKLTILLDFGARTMSGNAWTNGYNSGKDIVCPPFSLDTDPAFSDAEKAVIQEVWQRVSEDYAPFAVDVTTEFTSEAAITRTDWTDAFYGTRVLITPISSYIGYYGGIAYVGAYDDIGDYCKPALVFPENLGSRAKTIAEACSHECGHNLGLSHDGAPGQVYYPGSGSGETGWAPIMGNSYSQNLSQWSRGEYPNANNQQDDVAILRGYIGSRVDDVGDTPATAYVMPTGTSLAAAGLVNSSTDVDVYRFLAGGGTATLDVKPATIGPDLDILAEIRDANGNLVNSNNPSDALSARLVATLQQGTYYLLVSGTGRSTPLDAGGYSNYACLGNYTISGTVPAQAAAVAQPVFSPPGGLFATSVDVSMTCSTAGATIRYTTDGTTPTQASPAYAGTRLHLTATTTLRALAFKTGLATSELRSETYVAAGALSGAVTSAGAGLSGVAVSVPGSATVTTAADGSYTVRGLAPGTYAVTYSKTGYQTQTQSVTISSGATATKNIALVSGVTTYKNVHRFRNLTSGFYLWSADESEKDSIIANLSKTWVYEGVAYRIDATNPINQAPLWRFVSPTGGYYLYTADAAEKASIIARLPGVWRHEGEAFRVSTAASGSPVWRFRNLNNGTYLLSADPVERATINSNLKSTWLEEGAAYYLAP
jgi:hypothetical protein